MIRKHHPIDNELLERLLPFGCEVQAEKGDVLIQEGDVAPHFFLIVEGEVEIIKRSKSLKDGHPIANLKKGELVGELALVDNKPRSATVKATKPTSLLRFEIKDLSGKIQKELIHRLAIDLSHRLSFTTETIVVSLEEKWQERHSRNLMGLILVRTLIFLGLYILLFRVIHKQTQGGVFVFIPLMACLSFITYEVVKHSGYSWEIFGVTSKNWKKSIAESIVFLLPVLGVVVLIKWMYIRTTGVSIALFEPGTARFSPQLLTLLVVGYALLAPLQEFIARGVLQSLLARLLPITHKRRIWTSILVSNLLFASLHTYLGLGLACAAFLPGLFFGWLYARQKTLIGVSIAHALLGIWALYVVDIWPVLKRL